MAQDVTFDLADTVVPAGTLKMQVTVDMTNFPSLTGTTFYVSADHLYCNSLDALFLSEVVVGAKIHATISGVSYTLIPSSVVDDNELIMDQTFAFLGASNIKQLVPPTDNLVFDMDEHVERVDVKMGLYEYDDFTMQFADDYSYYAMGFWYYLFRLLAGSTVKCFVRMEESGVNSFVTYGTINPATVDFSELALSADPPTGARIRTVKSSIVSGLSRLKEILTVDVITELQTHVIAGSLNPLNHLANFNMVVSSIMKLAFNQTYDLGDLQIRNADMSFVASDGVTALTYLQVYMLTDVGGGHDSYLDPDCVGGLYWGTLYPTALDLLKAITAPYGFVPRYYYGKTDGSYDNSTPTNNRHRLEFLTRGNMANEIVMTGQVIESLNAPYSPYVSDSVRVSSRANSDVADYFFNSDLNPLSPSAKEVYGQAPTYLQFDIDIVTDFIVQEVLDHSGNPFTIGNSLFDDTGVPLSVVKTVFWNYKTNAWETVYYAGDTPNTLGVAGARYYFNRFRGQATYTRKYSDVRSNDGSTTSQRNTRCLRRHTIEDEVSVRTFYSIETKKSYTKNTARMTWFQE